MTQAEKREAFVKEILELYKDGFQVADAVDTVIKSMQYVGQFENWSGADKKQEVLAILQEVLDEFDTWGPDLIVDKIIISQADKLIDLFYDKFKGYLKF